MRQGLANVFSPYYVFRPRQLVQRVVGEYRQEDESRFTLPWGDEIICHANESVGLGIRRRGLRDLAVCEAMLRLADPGETAVDIGANIGQMTSLLAHAVGRSGRVIAFEPHPGVFALLARNTREWVAASARDIEARPEALSDREGVAELSTDVFETNEGSATLESVTTERYGKDVHTVPVKRLDDVVGDDIRIGVMKIDIEGHELQALLGARGLLAAGRIRDIVLEEREEPPTPVTRLLAEHGYALMRLGQALRGPTAGPLDDQTISTGFGDDLSLLATLAPERAIERLRVRGWAIYRAGPAGRIEHDRNPQR